MTEIFLLGVMLGVSAGFAPGPLLTLVVSETMRHGFSSGVRVAFAPLITDLPIVVISVFVLSKLSSFSILLGGISFTGGVFVFYMGYENFKVKPIELHKFDTGPRSLVKGVLVNFLSPHPYLFWMSVGAPTVIRSWNDTYYGPVIFIGGFYLMLVGSKIVLAFLTGKSKTYLTGRKYLLTMRILGFVLCGLSLVLIRDGMKILGY